MANPHRGDTAVEGTPYTLCFSSNSVCEMEEHFGAPISEVGAMLDGSAKLSHIRAVLWFGLRRHHPELSEEDAGDVLDEIGHRAADELIGTAFQRAFPKAKKGAASGSGRPRKAKGAPTR